MDSLHVPASTIQRVGRWLIPSSTSVLAVVLVTYRWFGSRASLDDVGTKVGKVTAAAAAAQSTAHHAASIAEGHTTELHALWVHVVAMRAELKVMREYSKQDSATRSRYIEEAQAFYNLRFEEQLRVNANAPAEAARLALLQQWRPDR